MSGWQKVMPDDHSEVVPLLPIPNRTVKRFSADDSAGSRVKVGHRQAITAKTPSHVTGRFLQCLQIGGVEENAKSVCGVAQNCAILQGFADRSKA